MKRYKYYNRNPDKIETKDCVCRAISTATGLQYDATKNLLELIAEFYDCEELCVCCYHRLLDDILCYHRVDVDFQQTVEEVTNNYSKNKIIMRVDRHLTCAIYGTILDIWDCSYELVDCLWIIQ